MTAGTVGGQSPQDFTGTWKWNAARSEIRSLPSPPDPVLRIEQKGSVLSVSAGGAEDGPFRTITYNLDGKESRSRHGNVQSSTVTKWEGSALLVNTLVSAGANHTVMERWKRTRDGSVLTIKRTIVRMGGEAESLLVYQNTAIAAAVPESREPEPTAPLAPRPPVARAPDPPPAEPEYVIDAGTKIPLSLINGLNTKTVAEGDRVYLQTTYPILSKGKIIIPAGSYVTGSVMASERAGRIKGRSSLHLRFDSLSLSNGTTRDFRARVASSEAKVDRKEGTIQGEGDKGGDARTVGEATAAGASVGGLAGAAAGRVGMGAGIGAAAGAAGGLIGVLAKRGPDVVLPKGTSFEMVLDRPLQFKASELVSYR